MTQSNELRTFRAFISYRHEDNRQTGRLWAEWLHRWIESYEVPQALVGTINLYGKPIPARVAPVFRDEWELAGGGNLRDLIEHALKASDAMIIVCSPRSARSRWVRGEVARFKQLGKGDRIIPVIIEGDPRALDMGRHPSSECLPRSYRRGVQVTGPVDARGHFPVNWRLPTDDRLAPDFRPKGSTEQGYTNPAAYGEALKWRQQLAPNGQAAPVLSRAEVRARIESYRLRLNLERLRLMAGLLGVELDDLVRRDADWRARRRLMIIQSLSAALVLVAGLLGWIYVQYRLSRSFQFAAQSELLFEQQPKRLQESLELASRAESAWDTPEARHALRRTLKVCPQLVCAVRFPDSPSKVKFSDDGLMFAACDSDGNARVHASETGRLIASFSVKSTRDPTAPKPTQKILDFAFSPSGDALVLVTDSGRISRHELFRKVTPRLLANTVGEDVGEVNFDASGRYLVTVCEVEHGDRVQVWDLEAASPCIRDWTYPYDTRGQWLEESGRLAMIGKWIDVWTLSSDSKDDQHVRFDGKDGFREAVLSRDGKYFAMPPPDSGDSVWPVLGLVAAADEATRLPHDFLVHDIQFSGDGKWLATASSCGSAKVWDVETRQEIGVFPHRGGVTACRFSGDNRFLLTGSGETYPCDSTARLWSIQNQEEIARFPHGSNVVDVAFNPHMTMFATVGWDKMVCVWRPPAMQPHYLPHPAADRKRRSWTNLTWREHVLALVCDESPPEEDRTATVWDISSNQTFELPYPKLVSTVAFDTTGSHLAMLSPSGATSWNLSLRSSRQIEIEDGTDITPFGGSDQWLVLSAGSPRLWKPGQTALGPPLWSNASRFLDLSYTSVKRWAAVSWENKKIFFADAGTHFEVPFVPPGTPPTGFMAISPDGAQLATCSHDSMYTNAVITLYKASDPGKAIEIRRSGRVFGLYFSPDSCLLACSEGDKTGRLVMFDRRGKEIQTFDYDEIVLNMVFSPDSSRFVTAVGPFTHKSQREVSVNFEEIHGPPLAEQAAGLLELWKANRVQSTAP